MQGIGDGADTVTCCICPNTVFLKSLSEIVLFISTDGSIPMYLKGICLCKDTE